MLISRMDLSSEILLLLKIILPVIDSLVYTTEEEVYRFAPVTAHFKSLRIHLHHKRTWVICIQLAWPIYKQSICKAMPELLGLI